MLKLNNIVYPIGTMVKVCYNIYKDINSDDLFTIVEMAPKMFAFNDSYIVKDNNGKKWNMPTKHFVAI